MDYISHAGAMHLQGHMCECCWSEVGEAQPIFYDLDGEVGERAMAFVWCACCWDALQKARIEAYTDAANLCRKYYVPDMATALMEKARAIADQMAEARVT